MNDEPLHQGSRSQLASMALVPLILLPGLLLITWLHFVGGTETQDRYDWTSFYIFLAINVPCAFGTAFGAVRLFSLVGIKKIAATILIGLVLYGISLFGSYILAYFMFGPRC